MAGSQCVQNSTVVLLVSARIVSLKESLELRINAKRVKLRWKTQLNRIRVEAVLSLSIKGQDVISPWGCKMAAFDQISSAPLQAGTRIWARTMADCICAERVPDWARGAHATIHLISGTRSISCNPHGLWRLPCKADKMPANGLPNFICRTVKMEYTSPTSKKTAFER